MTPSDYEKENIILKTEISIFETERDVLMEKVKELEKTNQSLIDSNNDTEMQIGRLYDEKDDINRILMAVEKNHSKIVIEKEEILQKISRLDTDFTKYIMQHPLPKENVEYFIKNTVFLNAFGVFTLLSILGFWLFKFWPAIYTACLGAGLYVGAKYCMWRIKAFFYTPITHSQD